jgi:2-iminobutanoate/2-iminopropanoate deaminase
VGRRQVLEVPGVSHDAPIPMGVRIGNLVTSSAIPGRDPANGELPADPARQAELMFQHVDTLMRAAGGSPADIAHVTVYVKDLAYREQVNREWLKMFPDETDRPARHTQLSDLRGGMLVQCELLAVLEAAAGVVEGGS